MLIYLPIMSGSELAHWKHLSQLLHKLMEIFPVVPSGFKKYLDQLFLNDAYLWSHKTG